MPNKTPCDGCIWKSRLWGMDYCIKGSWFGSLNEKLCAEYKRKDLSGHPPMIRHTETGEKK